jgi:hypothetical protein
MSKVFKAVGNVISGIGNVISSVVNTVVNVVSSVINFVASPFMGLLGGVPDMPDAGSQAAQQQGVLLQKQGTNESIPVIYGLRKVGGIVTFAETGSDNNKYLWVAYAFAEGCVEGLHELFIDDFQFSADTVGKLNGGNIVDVTDGKYNGRCQLQWFPGQLFVGSNSGVVGFSSICKAAPSWKSTMEYSGVAVLFARYEWKKIETQADSEANPYSGNIPKIQATILGRKVVSLLTTAVPDPSQYGYDNIPGAGGFRGGLERYSTNPAECLLDYLRNPRYGKGLKNADIDWDSFRIAAAKFNQQIQYTSGVRGPIMTTNVVLPTNQTLFQNVKLILQNSRSYLPYVQGKYKLKVEDAGNDTDIISGSATIAATFTRNNIQGDIQYTGIERSNKYNWVELTWVDPDQKYSNQTVVYPETEAERQTYVAQDGNRENSLQATFPAITNRQMALDMARLLFYKSRYQETCTLKVTSQAFELEPGDCIRIQSNILNFNTTPWRIVNIVLNDDYTFNLSCVRNPDWLYPYTKAGEADRVLPPFLPYGSQSILPSWNTPVSVGLLPPNYSYQITTTATNTTTNPPPTVVTTSSGGGVGGSTSTITIISTPPVILPLSDVVDFTQGIVTPISNDTVTIELRWNQPLHPQYDSVDIYYKASAERSYRKENVSIKPGAGRQITFRTGVLISVPPFNYYDFFARVKYSTGEYSTKNAFIQVKADGITGITITNPEEFYAVASPGWSLPLQSATARTDDYFGTIDIRPTYTVAPTFTDPRGLTINVRQMFTADFPVNYNICGVELFYKPSNTTYWRSRRVTNLNFAAGDDFTVTVGTSADTDTVLGSPGAYSTYDFILRCLYRNGTSSSQQIRIMTANIEDTTGNILFYAQRSSVEKVTAYQFLTYEQGVQSGAIADARDSKIGVVSIYDSYSSPSNNRLPAPSMTVVINPPDASIRDLFRGFKVYVRALLAGVNPTVSEFIYRSTVLNWEGGTQQAFDVPLTSIGYNKKFDIIVVPLVYYGNAVIEGRYCQYGSGYLNNIPRGDDYPSTGNWVTSFNFKETASAVALNTIATFIPQPQPVINLVGWEAYKDQEDEFPTPGIYQADYYAKTTPYLNQFYRLTYSVAHISGFNELQIYRRSTGPQIKGLVNTYYSQGRWEKITVTATNTAPNTVKVFLRAPTPREEYSPNKTYLQAGYKPGITSNPKLSAYTLFYPSISPDDEFIFVVKANGSVSTKAIYMKGDTLNATEGAGFKDLLPTHIAQEIDFPGGVGTEAPNGWEKRLVDARATPVAVNLLFVAYSIPLTDPYGSLLAGGALTMPTLTSLGLGPY